MPGTADADATFGNYQEARPQGRSRVGNTLNAAGKSTTASNLNALGFLLDEDESGQDAAWDAFGAGSIYNVSTGEWETPKKPEDYELESVKRAKEKASDWAYQKANEFNEEAAESEKLAKDGLGKAGQTLVDIGIAGSQLAGDVALNAALPGSGLAAMGVRSFGSATEKARNEGADMQQQFNYGATVAAAEVLSEKLFDAAKLFGGGGADDVVERIVSKLSKTDAGRTVTRMLLSGVGEGAEEAVTDLVEPAIRGAFYDKEAMLATYGTPEGRRELAAQAAYDALIDGVLGVAGGGVGILNGENAQKNTALRTQEQLRQAGYTGTVRQKTKADLEREARQADLFAGNLYRPGDPTRQLASAPKTGAETSGLTGTAENGIVEPTNGNVERARALLADGASPSQVFNETGLIVMADGSIRDSSSGAVVWRANDGSSGISDSTIDRRAERRGDRAGAPAQDGRGDRGTGGLDYSGGRAAGQRTGWADLNGEQRRAATDVIIRAANASGNGETAMLRAALGGDDAFAKRFYDLYQKGDAVAEQWGTFSRM